MSLIVRTVGETTVTYFNLARIVANAGPENIDIEWSSEESLYKKAEKLMPGAPRVWEELTSILMSADPYRGLKILERLGALQVLLPELTRCARIKQNLRYHTDNVFEHCLKVCFYTGSDVTLRWAGLLHDIGKFPSYKEGSSGEPTFHRHEVYSLKLASVILKRLGAPTPIANRIVNLVALHMYYYSSEWTDKTVCRFIDKLGLSELDTPETIRNHPLFRLRMADRRSRGLEERTIKQDDFEKRLFDMLRLSRQQPAIRLLNKEKPL